MSVMFCSFWAESVGGRLVRRLNSRKNPSRSIMLDAQRESYLARARVLNPEVLLPSKQQCRFVERFNNYPAYLSKCAQFQAKSSSVIRNPLSPRERKNFDKFLGESEIVIENDGDFTFLDRFYLNGLLVRTRVSERSVKTCDSIVAGRYASSDQANSEDFSDEEGGENLYIGQVTHIVKIEEEVFVNVAWFKHTDHSGVFSINQQQGLAPIRMKLHPLDHAWMFAGHLILQQHFLVGTVSQSQHFYVIVKV